MSLLRSVTTVGSYTLLSRVMGFVRDILTAALLGAGPVADAFFVAQRLPNLFRSLFAEGAFSAAFVPLFAGTMAVQGKETARIFAEDALAVLLAALLVFVLVGEIFMPWVMSVIAPGFGDDPEKFALAVALARITFPYLLFIALVALQGGVLNSVDRFAAAAATPTLLNLFLIAALLMMRRFGWHDGRALAWAITGAGLAQFLWLMSSCARAGLALRLPLAAPDAGGAPHPADHGAGRVRRRGHPGQSADLDSARVVSAERVGFVSVLRRPAEPAAAGRRRHCRRHRDPAALVAAIAARRACRRGRDAKSRARTGAAADPAGRGGARVLAQPILAVLFQRGAFGPADTAATAAALAAYAAGLPAFVLVKVLAPAFFARHDTATPVKIAVAAMAVNLALTLLLMQFLAHVGIALATSCAGWLNALTLLALLVRRGHFRLDARARRNLPRVRRRVARHGRGPGAAAHRARPGARRPGADPHRGVGRAVRLRA